MKVAMVGNFGLWHKGTMGARALPMARALVEKGHDVCLIIPPWDDPRSSGLEDHIEGVRVANVILPPRVPLLWHALLTVELLRRTVREPADVVHIFKPKAYAGLVQMAIVFLRWLRLLNVRIVLDTDDWEGKGGWNELESFPAPIKWLISCHERWCITHADAVTVASRALESKVLALGVPDSRVFYVPNGVWHLHSRRPGSHDAAPTEPRGGDASGWSSLHFDECSKRLAHHPTVLLYTRFFEFQVERAVDIFATVRRGVPGAKMLVIGRGLNGEEERLARLVQRAGLEDDIVCAGWIRASDLPRWFQLADVAIYPMDDTLLNRAKCPMKLVDLLSFGVPVVADRVGQVPEYVEDGVSGILITSDGVAKFAGEVAVLLQDACKRISLGARARDRVSVAFDWRQLSSEVERAYGGLR